MKKRNQRKTAIMSTLLLLLLTLILLITSTFAWFTSNQTVTISTLNVSVQATNGLQISADGSNWKAVLSNDDITGAHTTYAAATNQIPTQMAPVSTIGDIDTTTGFMKMFSGAVAADGTTGNYMITSAQLTDANATGVSAGNYIAFDIFLKVDAATQIYLNGTNSSVKFTTGKDDKGLQNATRIAFINEGRVDTGSTTATIQALKGGTTASTIIWEPNYDVHTAAAVANASDTYGITTATTGGSQLAYVGIKAAIADANAVNIKQTAAATTYFAAVSPALATTAGNTTNKALTNLNLAAGITKVRIYMWVEGQDVDCENTASGSYLSFDVQLTKLAA